MAPNLFSDALTKYRELAGLTQKQLAKRANVAPSSVNRWEHGETVPRLDNVEILDKVLGANGQLTIAWRVQTSGSALPDWARDLAAIERAARHVTLLSAAGVPGMLQCPEYASEVFRAGRPLATQEDLASLVDLRCGRLAELPDLSVTAVFPASAVGGLPEALRSAQAKHLLRWVESGRVTLCLVPAAMIVPVAPIMVYRLHTGERVTASDHAEGTVVLNADVSERVDAVIMAVLTTALPVASSLEYLENL